MEAERSYFKNRLSTGHPSALWNFVQYAIIVLILYQSANVFFISYFYMQSTIAIFLFLSFAFIFRINKLNQISRFGNLFVVQILLGFSLLCTILLNNDPRIQTYIGVFLQIVTAAMAMLMVDYKAFKNIYINVMIFFAAASLIFFAVQFIYPRIVYLFPMTPALVSTDYYNALIYVYQKLIRYPDLVLLKRNTSIFWEAGCYQAFLNVALMFICNDLEAGRKIEHGKFKIMLLIVTVVTTFSTTGFLVLLCILIGYHKIIFKNGSKHALAALAAGAGIVIFIFLALNGGLLSDFFAGKLKREFSDPEYILSRISFSDLNYIFYNGNFNFFGISYSTFQQVSGLSTNSILHTLACYGFLYTGILLWLYYKYARSVIQKSGLMALVFLLIFSSEELLGKTFFLCLAFTGILYAKENAKRNENSLALQRRAADGGSRYIKSRP